MTAYGQYDLLVCRPSDNVATSGAAWAEFSGTTINVNYPLTRLDLQDPAKGTKSTTTGDFRIVKDFGSAQRIDAVWIPKHNVPAGGTIKIEGHTSNTWGAPACTISYTVPTYLGGLPIGVFVDVRQATGYSTGGFQYWSIYVVNPSQATALTCPILCASLTNLPNLFRGITRPRNRLTVTNLSDDGGEYTYDLGEQGWSVAGQVRAGLTAYAAYLDLWGDCRDNVRQFAVVLDTHLAQPEGFVVKWQGGFSPTNTQKSREMLQITWRQRNRGGAL